MKIIENIAVPTGNILIVDGDHGKLECLSLRDYGKDVNLKADFMGLTKDIGRVEHQKMLPLSDKWVVTISTQYGCSSGCKFCDVPKVGPGINATYNDLLGQVETALLLHPEVKHTDRLNIHFARMGEPTWNTAVLDFAMDVQERLYEQIGNSLIHPVVSTMLPKKNQTLLFYVCEWMRIKNKIYKGDAGLQFSINSTCNKEREEMFSGNSISLEAISQIGHVMPKPVGRKITLNFAVAGYEIDALKLRRWFDPSKFVVKLTPMHKTAAAIQNGIETAGEYTSIYPYQKIEEDLKNAGFDVLVFIASKAEDDGRITCGNAILSGTKPKTSAN